MSFSLRIQGRSIYGYILSRRNIPFIDWNFFVFSIAVGQEALLYVDVHSVLVLDYSFPV